MSWIKAHLTIVICGAVSVIAIALLVLGFVLSDVQKLMAADASMLQRIKSVPAVNEQMIGQLEKQRDDNDKQVKRILEELARVGQHKPLQDDVFPTISPLKQEAPFQFKHAYFAAFQQMVAQLKAKDAPTQEEATEEADRMERERQKAESLAALGAEEDRGRARRPGPATGAPRTGSPGRPSLDRANMTPEELAREDPMVRVSIFKARSAYCYANVSSFNPFPTITQVDRPVLEEMWYAQIALWIQQDIVTALANLNEREAKKFTDKGEEAWVGNLPVKHLLSFTVGGYLPPSSGESSGGGRLAGGGSETFTPRGSGDSVDVIHFSLDLIVAARMLPEVIDAICVAGFYTPLMVRYEEVPPNTELVGYIYGSAPSIRVRLDVEGCFLRTKYEKLMPDTVRKAIEAGTAASSGAAGGGGGGGGMSPLANPRGGGGMRGGATGNPRGHQEAVNP